MEANGIAVMWARYLSHCVCLLPGYVHGLADSLRQRGPDPGACVCFPGVRNPGAPLGLQPHLWHGASGHYAPGGPLPQTHRLFCASREDPGVTTGAPPPTQYFWDLSIH